MHFLTSATRRRKVLLLSFSLVLALLLLSTLHQDVRSRFHALSHGRWPAMGGGDTSLRLPTYDAIIEQERTLPQHNMSLPYPEGKAGRYVKFTNQINQLGWNNVLNELLLCSHLAWRSKRAYVFQDYVWKIEYYPWNVPTWPAPRTPLSALIAGPTAGGPWAEGDDTPRSVSAAHFDAVCPPEDTENIDTDVAKEPIRDADGKYAMEHWLRLLNESPKRCVNIIPSSKDGFPQTFDLWLISTPRILTVWEQFRDSPVSRLLQTSPLVNSAIERNEHLFFPASSSALQTKRYAGMLVMHLRRGDYLGACQGLATWSSTFYEWNLLPFLPDRFEPPPGGSWGKNTPENEAIYFKRCYPTEEQLIAKITESKLGWESGAEGRNLSTLYIMTNADKVWLSEFKQMLLAAGWTTVVTSHDLAMDSEQTAVAMAVDMDIGRRGAVFIGNGWSSLTSNVVHRRLVDGNDPSSIRFW